MLQSTTSYEEPEDLYERADELRKQLKETENPESVHIPWQYVISLSNLPSAERREYYQENGSAKLNWVMDNIIPTFNELENSPHGQKFFRDILTHNDSFFTLNYEINLTNNKEGSAFEGKHNILIDPFDLVIPDSEGNMPKPDFEKDEFTLTGVILHEGDHYIFSFNNEKGKSNREKLEYIGCAEDQAINRVDAWREDNGYATRDSYISNPEEFYQTSIDELKKRLNAAPESPFHEDSQTVFDAVQTQIVGPLIVHDKGCDLTPETFDDELKAKIADAVEKLGGVEKFNGVDLSHANQLGNIELPLPNLEEKETNTDGKER